MGNKQNKQSIIKLYLTQAYEANISTFRSFWNDYILQDNHTWIYAFSLLFIKLVYEETKWISHVFPKFPIIFCKNDTIYSI